MTVPARHEDREAAGQPGDLALRRSRARAPPTTLRSTKTIEPTTSEPAPAPAIVEPRTARRSSLLVAVAQFGLVGLLAVTVLGLAAAQRLRNESQSAAIRDARDRAVPLADGIVAPRLTDELLAGEPAAVAEMDRAARDYVAKEPVLRLKVWDLDGHIVYADDHRLIGLTFPIEAQALEAAARGESYADITNLTDAENVFEQGYGRLLEVYRPVTAVGGRHLLYEHYQRLNGVTQSARRFWSRSAPLLLGSLLVLQLMQLPLAWSLGRRVRAAQRQRAELLQRALDASDTERRRIARDLHDGIVQDLIGVSYAVGAVLQDPGVAGSASAVETLGEVRAGTQRSIKGLRTLLVDIYPPTLEQGDLVGALNDLVAPYQSKGITGTVTSTVDGDLTPAAKALVYRTVREAMSNVARHAGAADVTIVLADAPDDRVELTIRDDGRGFNLAELAARRDEGHLGLRLLSDLTAAAGGEVTIASAPGRGTTISLRTPR